MTDDLFCIPSVTITHSDGSTATWYGIDEEAISNAMYDLLGQDNVIIGPDGEVFT